MRRNDLIHMVKVEFKRIFEIAKNNESITLPKDEDITPCWKHETIGIMVDSYVFVMDGKEMAAFDGLFVNYFNLTKILCESIKLDKLIDKYPDKLELIIKYVIYHELYHIHQIETCNSKSTIR